MKYVEYLNGLIKERVLESENSVLFGQNINSGSCLGGLTRNIKLGPNSKIIDSTNTENSLVGFGFGLMINGKTGVFLMKQLDFLLLGIDQLVNTYNIIRSINHQPAGGSFTIVATVVDSGFEGPQSSFNGLSDLCSIAHIEGFTVTNKTDAGYIFSNHFMKPGFRIIGLSQRLGKMEIENREATVIEGGRIFKYSNGNDATIVSFNFSFPQAAKLNAFLGENNVHASHFHVNSTAISNWDSILENARTSRKLILIDDSKSFHTSTDILLAKTADFGINRKIVLKRDLDNNWLHPVSDIFEIDEQAMLAQLA